MAEEDGSAVLSAIISGGRALLEAWAAKPWTPPALAVQIHRYRSAALLGERQTAARSGTPMRKRHALARRLLDRQDDYLRFTTDWRISTGNNGFERYIRMTS